MEKEREREGVGGRREGERGRTGQTDRTEWSGGGGEVHKVSCDYL